MPVVNVTEDQHDDGAGNLTDVYVITYTVPGHPDRFTLSVPQGDDPVAAAAQAIAAKTAEIQSIYGL